MNELAECTEIEAPPKSGGSELTRLLSTVIRKAFDNERAFIDRFWHEQDDAELLECYMASERTRITVLTEIGDTVTTTIPTMDFLEWAEGR